METGKCSTDSDTKVISMSRSLRDWIASRGNGSCVPHGCENEQYRESQPMLNNPKLVCSEHDIIQLSQSNTITPNVLLPGSLVLVQNQASVFPAKTTLLLLRPQHSLVLSAPNAFINPTQFPISSVPNTGTLPTIPSVSSTSASSGTCAVSYVRIAPASPIYSSSRPMSNVVNSCAQTTIPLRLTLRPQFQQNTNLCTPKLLLINQGIGLNNFSKVRNGSQNSTSITSMSLPVNDKVNNYSSPCVIGETDLDKCDNDDNLTSDDCPVDDTAQPSHGGNDKNLVECSDTKTVVSDKNKASISLSLTTSRSQQPTSFTSMSLRDNDVYDYSSPHVSENSNCDNDDNVTSDDCPVDDKTQPIHGGNDNNLVECSDTRTDLSEVGKISEEQTISLVASHRSLAHLQPDILNIPENYLQQLAFSEGRMVRIFPPDDFDVLKRHLSSDFYDKYDEIYGMLFDIKFASNLMCKYCDSVFETRELLISHIEDIHPTLNIAVPCDLCKEYPKNGIDRYVKHWIQHFYNNQCNSCCRRFSKKYVLASHVRAFHREDRVNCEVCHKCFRPSYLPIHMKVHQSQKEKMKQKYSCDICGAKVLHIEDHIAVKHSNEKTIKCNFCDKSFSTEKSFTAHLKRHREKNLNPDVNCDICCAKFKCKRSLRSHFERVHDPSAYKFSCEPCNRKFVKHYELRSHNMWFHESKRPFQCDVCQKSFKTKNYLEIHMDVHSDELKHLCTVCGKSFRMKANLYIHMKVHRKQRKRPLKAKTRR